MSVKNDLEQLVALQAHELQLLQIDGDLATIAATRARLQAEIDAAQQVVKAAEDDLEEARSEARRMDLDLKTAEERVSGYKDKVMAVKTNQELWALQEEIGHAEGAVGDVETGILEQMEKADALEAVIGEKRVELTATQSRVDAGNADCDAKASALEGERTGVRAAIDELSGRIPDDLRKRYEDVKTARQGVAVAEALDETCLVCNFRMRPQLYVEVFNLAEIIHCENCKRILYVADRLDIPESMRRPSEAPVDGAAEPPAASPAAEMHAAGAATDAANH